MPAFFSAATARSTGLLGFTRLRLSFMTAAEGTVCGGRGARGEGRGKSLAGRGRRCVIRARTTERLTRTDACFVSAH